MSKQPVTMPMPSDGMPVGYGFAKPVPTPMPGPLRMFGASTRKLPVATVHNRQGFIRRVRLWLSLLIAPRPKQFTVHISNLFPPFVSLRSGIAYAGEVEHGRLRPAPTSLPGPGESRRM